MQKKILIIDDEPEIVKMLTDRLTVHGFDTASATDGESGYEKARKYSPDIILMDVTMPGWSGIETANRLKANAGTADIPIIFLTGLSEESISRQYLEKADSFVLLKPFDAKELLELLSSKLDM